MAYIELITTWKASLTGIGTSGGKATGTGICFNTDTKLVENFYGSVTLALLDPVPRDEHLPAGAFVWFECNNFTETQWFFDGVDNTYTKVVYDSPACGWTPPPPPPLTCDLVLSVVVNGDTATATTSGAHGNVTYSIDGGVSVQASPIFAGLAAHKFTLTAYDDGPANCYRTQDFVIGASVPNTSPVPGALPDVGFSRNPLALRVRASAPSRSLLLELWAETAHGSGTYTRLVQRVRPGDAQGEAVFQMQDQLHAALLPERPDLTRAPGLLLLTSSIRRYYPVVAEIQPATGKPGPLVPATPRTVLRGGLPWALARANTYFNPTPGGLLTWRPAGEVQEVGAGHVALLARLLPATVQAVQVQVHCYLRGQTLPFATVPYDLALTGPTLRLVRVQLPVEALPADTHRLEVQWLADTVPLPGRARYRLVPGRRRDFVFLNSLGQWDTLSCPGLSTLSSKTSAERTVATRLLPPDYDPQDGPESVAAVQVDTRMTISTGPLSPTELAYLRELFTSTDVYEVHHSRQLRKIRLTTKDFIDYQDNAGADGFAFEYAYAFDTSLYDYDRITNG
jgi:hypothetical protein